MEMAMPSYLKGIPKGHASSLFHARKNENRGGIAVALADYQDSYKNWFRF